MHTVAGIEFYKLMQVLNKLPFLFPYLNTPLQVIFINFRFGSPRFRAAILETSSDGGVSFEPIQYFADDCMAYFNLPNNGAITAADDVNCITSQSL